MKITNDKLSTWLIPSSLLIAFILPRLIGLAKFATLDEPYWLLSGSNFYYALGQRQFFATVWDYHPAVTTMWIITLVMLFYFPAYRGQGQGYFYVYKEWKYEDFLHAFGRQAVDVLFYGRLLQVIILALLFLLLYWLLQKIFSRKLTVFALLLMSIDPMFLGHSRLLTHEAMMSTFLLTSFASLAVYQYIEKKTRLLVLSGVLAGLAQLTKSSGIVLFPIIILLFIVEVWEKRKADPILELIAVQLRALMIWLFALCAIYFLIWPAMWVNPISVLSSVYGNALSYSLEGGRLYSTGGFHKISLEFDWSGILFFIDTMLWRTTPLIWIGILASPFIFIDKEMSNSAIKTIILVFLMGIIMLMLFGLAKGRDSAHYVLLTYMTVDLWVATALFGFWNWLKNLGASAALNRILWMAITALFSYHIISIFSFYPYYYTYFSPIMEAGEPGIQNGNLGYGEGLDLAAEYLNQKGHPEDLTVLAYWSEGPFSYFFKGQSYILINNYYKPELKDLLLKDLYRSDYLVIYYQPQKNLRRIMNVVNALEPYPPEKVIWMNGIEYIHIYKIKDLPPEFFQFINNQ